MCVGSCMNVCVCVCACVCMPVGIVEGWRWNVLTACLSAAGVKVRSKTNRVMDQ